MMPWPHWGQSLTPEWGGRRMSCLQVGQRAVRLRAVGLAEGVKAVRGGGMVCGQNHKCGDSAGFLLIINGFAEYNLTSFARGAACQNRLSQVRRSPPKPAAPAKW